jgi:hypothetical protein
LAKKKGLSTAVNDDIGEGGGWQVGVFWGADEVDAVEKSIDRVKVLDCMITMVGERVWPGFVPIYPLPGIGVNAKANTRLCQSLGLIPDYTEMAGRGGIVGYMMKEMSDGFGVAVGRMDRALDPDSGIPVDGAKNAVEVIQQMIN